jgi:hypothetical protein
VESPIGVSSPLPLPAVLESSGVFCPWWAWVAGQVGSGTVGGVAVPDCGRARLEVVIALRPIEDGGICNPLVRPLPSARVVVVSARVRVEDEMVAVAVCQPFFKTLKVELVDRRSWPTKGWRARPRSSSSSAPTTAASPLPAQLALIQWYERIKLKVKAG